MINAKDYKLAKTPEDFLKFFTNGDSFESIIIEGFSEKELVQYLLEENSKEAKLIYAYCLEKGKGVEKDPKKALDIYLELSEDGDPLACAYVSLAYLFGDNVKKDLKKAFKYCKTAADGGLIESMYQLGIMYRNGDGVKKNPEESFRYFEKAADNGQVESLYNIALYYLGGEVVEQDISKGISYLKIAANNDFADAAYNLGVIYENGDLEGVIPDLFEAFQWYLKAAKLGDIISSCIIGDYYKYGMGCKANQEEAFKYYLIAAEDGFPEAMEKVATCYRNGEGCAMDLEKAENWEKSFAESYKEDTTCAEYEKEDEEVTD